MTETGWAGLSALLNPFFGEDIDEKMAVLNRRSKVVLNDSRLKSLKIR